MSKHIALLMGGRSPEKEVSFTSGKSIKIALEKLGHKVTIIDPGKDLGVILNEIKPDVVFNALHGTYGEDGAIPGLLEVMELPYTHSGISASAICMNKYLTKKILENYGVRFAKSLLMNFNELIALISKGEEPLPKPYVIKPINQGSTLGVYIMQNDNPSFTDQIQIRPWAYGQEVLIEEYIPGQEISTVVINDIAIGSLELRPHSGFYDYESKYSDGKTEHIYPANIPELIYKESLKFAEIAHIMLGCRTLSRSDMRYSSTDGKLYFLEINTHPGFTDLSIVPDVAQRNGIEFIDLVEMILNDARLELK